MTQDNFDKTIRAFQKRVPFRSFRVELVNDSFFDVDHPEALVFRGGVAVFIDAAGQPILFDHDSVAKVTFAPKKRVA